ncbi:MAG TPA: response regulator transcription factor, partial [Terriglobales bacterium]|nr:response regulator transcription factor [Terriglobales bacterium]
MNTIPILIIDDDEELCALLSKALSREGFEVSSSHDAESGLKRALEGNHRLIILDVMLPGGNGIELLRKLRRSSAIPVIMLTARGDDRDRIDGLELGADDYVPKPFNTRELAARIRAVLRRIPKTPAPEILSVGDVEVNLVRHEVLQLGKPVDLTGSEYDILVLLLQSAGEAVSRETL